MASSKTPQGTPSVAQASEANVPVGPGQPPEATAPEDAPGEFAQWVDEKSEALKFRLGEQFPVPPPALHSPSVHVETSRQNLEEVLLEHESPSPEFLEELAVARDAAPLPDDELARQALNDGGADGDTETPE